MNVGSKAVMLSAVGDMSFGDFHFRIGHGVRSLTEKAHRGFLFDGIRHVFKDSDLVFGNLETSLSNHGWNGRRPSTMEMRGDPQQIEGLRGCGFNVLNVANNHAMQHGKDAFRETVALLERRGIHQVGLAGDDGWCSRPATIERRGLKFGFLGYAFETDRFFDGPLEYAFGRDETIKADVERLRADVDYLIVSYHWGLEFMDRPSVGNLRLGRQTVEWGADLVLGHHPHVLQGVERYGNGIIFYSLGNFIFDMSWDVRFRQSVIAEVTFGGEERVGYRLVPVMINESFQPEPADEKTARRIEKLMGALSARVHEQLSGDVELNARKYYREFERLKNRNRWRSYRFFLQNLLHVKPATAAWLVSQTLQSRLEGLSLHGLRRYLTPWRFSS